MSSIFNSTVRSAAIGLDIGSNAVRAAEISRGRKGTTLERYAQVGLPHGSVVDGEIIDPGAVVVALRRLWSEGGFSSRNLVLAVSGQRVIVRRAEVPAMSESDFRSALRFQAMDLIPIPVDDALLDFVVIPPDDPSRRGDQMQILLAAAHRGAVDAHLTVLRDASLHAVAIDPAPMAAVRALDLSSVADTATVALVDIGADITLVAVRAAGRLRYSRILNSGGSDLTARLAERLTLEQAEAESIKRHGSSTGTALTLLPDEVDPLVAEIETSLAFFAGQMGANAPERVLLTGGGSRSPELVAELARRLPVPVEVLDVFTGLDHPDLDLDPFAALAAATSGLLPVGAAEWTFEAPNRRLSLLPGEMAAAAAVRRRVVAVGAGIAVLAGGLAAVTLVRDHQLRQVRSQVAAIQATDLRSQERINALAPVTQLNDAIQARLADLQADSSDDLAWTTLLREITAAMPPKTHLTSLVFTDAATDPSAGATSSSSSSSATASSSSGVTAGTLGSVTMSVTGPASEEQVAVWLRALRHVSGLSSVWIPSATVSGGKVIFTSTGGITSRAPMVDRNTSVGVAR